MEKSLPFHFIPLVDRVAPQRLGRHNSPESSYKRTLRVIPLRLVGLGGAKAGLFSSL